jgi:retinol-binding protein 3
MRFPLPIIAALVLLVSAASALLHRSYQDPPAEEAPVVSAGDESAHKDLYPITPAERAKILERVLELVEANYVMADTALMITTYLRDQDVAGAYDHISDAATLAEILTPDLQMVNGDRHLSVRHARPDVAVGEQPGRPAAAISRGPAALGFTRVEMLDGSVGYIELGGAMRQGSDSQVDHAVMAEVLGTVEDADAVILDLRLSPGGSAGLANLLVSHFLPPDVHLFTVDSRRTKRMDRRHTRRIVPGPRMLDVRLYVLTSRSSFSAAEDIAFSLQSQGRAVLLGERTGGGGRNNLLAQIGHGMTVSISITRVLDPRTGEEAWERRGVAPDIETPAGDALKVALRLARDSRPAE